MTLIMFWQFFFVASLIGSASYALTMGGWPERTGAIITVLATVLTVIANMTLAPKWHSIDRGALMVDILVLASFVNLSLLCDRFWPIWAASFQIPIVAIDFAPALTDVSTAALSNAQVFWCYPTFLSLIVGTRSFQLRRRERIAGTS